VGLLAVPESTETSDTVAQPEKGCRDGFQFACGYGCGESFQGTNLTKIARRAARHYNEKHGNELRHRYDVVETVERGGDHIQDNIYQVERIDIYLTVFDVVERIGGIDGWLADPDSDRVCSACYCHIPDTNEQIEDKPDVSHDDSWTCTECIKEQEVTQRNTENKQLTEWSN
jgi:hypothetical protein